MQEAIWEDLPQELWRTGYSNLGLMKLLLITGPPVLNLPGVSLAGDEWALCSKPEWQLSLLFDTLHFKAGQGHLLWSSSFGFLLVIHASFSFYELNNRVRNKWSKFSNHKYSKAKYDPSVLLSCSHRHTHTHTQLQSPRASPQVLGYSVKQLEWADITEGCLCSWFPLHFEVSSAHRNRGHKAWLVWRVWALCRVGRVWGRLQWRACPPLCLSCGMSVMGRTFSLLLFGGG